jgi:hypothetical protein
MPRRRNLWVSEVPERLGEVGLKPGSAGQATRC